MSLLYGQGKWHKMYPTQQHEGLWLRPGVASYAFGSAAKVLASFSSKEE